MGTPRSTRAVLQPLFPTPERRLGGLAGFLSTLSRAASRLAVCAHQGAHAASLLQPACDPVKGIIARTDKWTTMVNRVRGIEERIDFEEGLDIRDVGACIERSSGVGMEEKIRSYDETKGRGSLESGEWEGLRSWMDGWRSLILHFEA